MSIFASLSVSQGSSATSFKVTDTTGGSETITARTLILYKADGSVYRQPGQATDAIDFSPTTYPSNEITISGLDKDYAFSVTMTLTPSSPVGGSTYTVTTKIALVAYSMKAFYDRMLYISENPKYEANLQFVSDTQRIFQEQEIAKKAAASSDITSAQLCLTRAKRIATYSKIPY